MQENILDAALPSELGSLSSLRFLNVSYNQLSGSLPSTFGELLQSEDSPSGTNLRKSMLQSYY